MSLQNIKKRKFTDNQFIWEYCSKAIVKKERKEGLSLKNELKYFEGNKTNFESNGSYLQSKQTQKIFVRFLN